MPDISNPCQETITILTLFLEGLKYIAGLAFGATISFFFTIRRMKRTNKLNILTNARDNILSEIERIKHKQPISRIAGDVSKVDTAINSIKSFISTSESTAINKHWKNYYKKEHNRHAGQPKEKETKVEIVNDLNEIIKIIDKKLV